jgi:chromosome segregation ATPase
MKPRLMERIAYPAMIAALLCSGGCMLFKKAEVVVSVLQEDFSLLEPEEFPEKIKQLEEIALNHESMTVRTKAFYYVAIAYMHYNNPEPNYPQALKNLDEYITRDTENETLDEVVAWKAVLIELDRCMEEIRKLEKSIAQLRQQYARSDKNRKDSIRQIEELSQTIEQQKKEIMSLEDKIKKLDALHLEIERKKKKK